MASNRTGYLGTNGVVLLGRAPDKFFSITTTQASNVAAWTPTSGKRFRLIRAHIHVTADAAAATAGPVTISLLDSSTQIGIARSAYVPAAAGVAAAQTFEIDLGPVGYLSSAANNVLNVLLARALTSGTVRVVVSGVEE